MLARYQMKRGATVDELPAGRRIDTRVHTKHPLRPTSKTDVERLIANLTPATWKAFAALYRATLDKRFAANRAPFDELAQAARDGAVFLGCSCPTTKNPDVRHCHTWLALEFMQARYPDLDVRFPK